MLRSRRLPYIPAESCARTITSSRSGSKRNSGSSIPKRAAAFEHPAVARGGKMTLRERAKSEMHQSMVELGSEICQDVAEARKQVAARRSDLSRAAAASGLKIASAGTHPFAHWKDQLIPVPERYATIVKDM